ncbi:uncharacterized protein N7469_006223 [Penicillium citrinum]|uniref:SAP domain-containing protein n=1 Tax=Penicillium citrinum TaxID=5077 RepID=A0A9W9NXW8_PENCI|nr:uncharacterized protein N7469_006223 [Penicillium citrinum]KAJ5231635.1 hypothetical protein N7469_006223 [Penicillium citrinum]KAK5787771.1 hypothetical protein VI817_010268 [Penicillium citrinum]
MRLTPTLLSLSTQPQWQTPWLSNLRLSVLQKLARATGIPSTGPRKEIATRINEVLEIQRAGRNTRTDFLRQAGPLSILSIDMGIQNLAFAHLKLDNPYRDLDGQGDGNELDIPRPEITAWRRLPLSDIASLKGNSASAILKASENEHIVGELSGSDHEESDTPVPKSFSLPYYAETAHTLLHTLVSKYKPTHILIERQRFRTGSSSHVQEWTIRVGLFEAMLYAALEVMKKERGGNLADLGVHGIDPKRVVQYWGEKEIGFTSVEGEDKDKKRRPTSREVKKAKIELVAKWLEAEFGLSESSTSKIDSGARRRVDISGSESVRSLAEAYLARLRTPAKRGLSMRGRPRGETVANDVIKLDDLADCLLQGVTWMEWIRMREMVVRKGMAVLEEI